MVYTKKEDSYYFKTTENYWLHESLMDIYFSMKEELNYGNI